MKNLLIIVISFCAFFNLNAQIVIDNTTPYDNPIWLVNNILLGGGVTTSNVTYQGETVQIGWFDAINTNLGIDSGIVMCTGDIYALYPINAGAGGFIPNTVIDPDLLTVANSVGSLLLTLFQVIPSDDVVTALSSLLTDMYVPCPYATLANADTLPPCGVSVHVNPSVLYKKLAYAAVQITNLPPPYVPCIQLFAPGSDLVVQLSPVNENTY